MGEGTEGTVLAELAGRLRLGVTAALAELQQVASQAGELPRTEEVLRIALELATIAQNQEAQPRSVVAGRILRIVPATNGASGAALAGEAPSAGVFIRDGDMWTLIYRGRSVRFRDSLGFAYLHRLVQEPARRIPSIALAGGLGIEDAGLEGDGATRAAQRLADELRAEMEEARLRREFARVRHLQARIESVGVELGLLSGRGAASEGAPQCAERARLNVSRAIVAALRRIAGYHPDLGAHLRATVRTGRFCVYAPDPRVPMRWET